MTITVIRRGVCRICRRASHVHRDPDTGDWLSCACADLLARLRLASAEPPPAPAGPDTGFETTGGAHA
jgi:hypothetical protein